MASLEREGWRHLTTEMGESEATVSFVHPSHGHARVRFAHVEESVDGAHLKTPAFRLAPEPVSDATRALVTQIARRLMRLDLQWWRAVAQGRDPELLGLLAGIRTAIRLTVLPDEVDTTVARYRERGLAVSIVDERPDLHDYRDHLTVCIARSGADAAVLAEACKQRDNRALGRLLGYPSCCVEAFHARNLTAPADVGEFGGACAAWVAAGYPRLNNLLFGERARYISFEPCSYLCDAALGVADAVARAIAEVDPHYVARADRTLATTIAIRRDGVRARVEVDHATITRASSIARFPGAPPEDESFAVALVGRVVGDAGRLPEDVLVCSFLGGRRVEH